MRLGTFNVENLFTRFRFARGVHVDAAFNNGFTSEDMRERIADPEAKRLTAEVMLACNADVWALQEVEDARVLRRFRDQHLGGASAFPHVYCLEGNDSRGIDVAVLSRFPIVHLRSWQRYADDDGLVFSRDCLEVDVDVPGSGVLTVYVNHLKSMRAELTEGNGRELTRRLRERQCEAIQELVTSRFSRDPSDARFVIAGDLNDYPEDDDQGHSAIHNLLAWDAIVDIGNRTALPDRWTHFWKGVPREGLRPKYRRLDYLLPSRRLAAENPHPPHIERRGTPLRADRFSGPRFQGIGRDYPKASDHCAVVWDLG